MRIEVTQGDIDTGCRKTSQNCPIAIAVSRAVGKRVGVSENLVSIYFNGGVSQVCKLPSEATKFITRYDAGYRPAPFGFELEVK